MLGRIQRSVEIELSILSFFSKTEIDDMIRKPTNLLLTKTLKNALVELTAAESDTQLTFSQVKYHLHLNKQSINHIVLARTNLHQYLSFRKCNALSRRLHCCFSTVRKSI